MSRVATYCDGAVLHVVMQSPPVNSFDVALLTDILDAVRLVGPETGAVVIRSAVDKIFAAGGDLKFMTTADEQTSSEYVALCREVYSSFENPAFVSIAAIDGACLAGGLELALGCDIRVASPSSRLGLPEAALGILAGAGAIHRLVRALGQGAARDLLLTGEPITGTQAFQWGLVSRLADEPLVEATRLAERVAAFSPEALAATKELAFDASTDDFADGLVLEHERWMQVRRGANAQEGLESFGEKRAPVFWRPT